MLCNGMLSRRLELRLIYSASVFDKHVSDCNFEDQEIGQVACLMMKPDHPRADLTHLDSSRFQRPEKSALAQTSK